MAQALLNKLQDHDMCHFPYINHLLVKEDGKITICSSSRRKFSFVGFYGQFRICHSHLW